MAIKIKLKSVTPVVDEAAKWRDTSFNTELTQDELDSLISKHGADVLGAHYDNGVPTGKDYSVDSSGVEKPAAPATGKDLATPQTSFNPRATWHTPVGIYYYPLSWAADRIMEDRIPFAGKSKYIYIYKIKDPSKRLDVTAATQNGFIEDVIFDLAKSGKGFTEVLKASGARDEATKEINELFFGENVSLTKDMIGERIKLLFLRYAEEQYGTLYSIFFGHISRGIANRNALYDYTQAVAIFADDLADYKPETGLKEYNITTIGYWHPPIEAILKEMGLEDLFFEAHQKVLDGKHKDNPNFKAELAGAFQNLNSEYLDSNSAFLNSPLKTLAKKPSIGKPPPPKTIFSIMKKHGSDEQITVLTCYYIINNFMDRKPANVTKYLLSKGYDVLEDTKGVGAIHEQERYQGVFLRVGAAQLVGVYLNRFRENRGKSADIGPKDIPHAKLLELLRSPNATKYIKVATDYAQKYPNRADIIGGLLVGNPNLKRTPQLADQIAEIFTEGTIQINTLNAFIDEFSQTLSLKQLESAVAKILSKINKNIINEQLINGRHYLYQFMKNAFKTLEIDESTPTLKMIADAIEQDSGQKILDDLIAYLGEFEISYIKEIFPKLLKVKLPDGEPIAFATIVSNIVEHLDFKNKPIEERMEFIEWMFNTYPQAWSDDVAIRSALSSMRYVRKEDDVTPEAEEAYIQKRRAGFYHKLLVHWQDMKEDPKLLDKLAKERAAINKKFGVTTESRFKKLNRIGNRWSRFG